MVLDLGSAISTVSKLSKRINIKEVSWPEFHERIEGEFPRFREELLSGISTLTVNDKFIDAILKHLIGSGGTRMDELSRKRRIQPLCRLQPFSSGECNVKIRERRNGYKAYYRDQAIEKKIEFNRRDAEVKRFLRQQKRSYCKACCELLDP